MNATGRILLQSLIASALLASCTDAAQPAAPSIPELGVERVVIDDSVQRTIVRGLDAAGVEIARLDLIHGAFKVTAPFAEYFGEGATVIGRKVDVSIHGRTRLTFETSGFDPILHMPAHPASERELETFLEDPAVKPVLDAWKLGWDPSERDGNEDAFTVGTITGSSPFDCSYPATNCGGTADGAHGNMNTCGGNTPAWSATRISRTDATYGTEYKIAQCCPSNSQQPTDWFATKACSTNPSAQVCNYNGGTNNGVMTSCGCQGATLGCVGCGAYPAADACTTSSTSTAINYCYVTADVSGCNPSHGRDDCCGAMMCDSASWTCSYCYWVGEQRICE